MPEERVTDEQALLKIRTLYDAGVPLFTKTALRDLHDQIEAAAGRAGEAIVVKALDGSTVTVRTATDIIDSDPEQPGQELIAYWSKPLISYSSIEWLTWPDRDDSESRLHSLRVGFPVHHRDKVTKKSTRPTPQPREDVEAFFARMRSDWESGETCTKLAKSLRDALPTGSRKIIAFACGSMARGCSPTSREDRRTAYQHALVLTLRDLLSERGQDRVQCYAQDPAYVDADQHVLKANGVEVLGDPKGFLEVDDSTVVISIAPNVPVHQIIADIARPAMMIWERTSKDSEGVLMTDPISSRVKRMISGDYDEIPFPLDTDNFGPNLAVFVRRTGVSNCEPPAIECGGLET